jgi:hypothetical protein
VEGELVMVSPDKKLTQGKSPGSRIGYMDSKVSAPIFSAAKAFEMLTPDEVRAKVEEIEQRALIMAENRHFDDLCDLFLSHLPKPDRKNPFNIMIVARLVKIWLRMATIEKLVEKFGAVSEGKLVRTNDLVYYLSALDNHFRSYLRLLHMTPEQKIKMEKRAAVRSSEKLDITSAIAKAFEETKVVSVDSGEKEKDGSASKAEDGSGKS